MGSIVPFAGEYPDEGVSQRNCGLVLRVRLSYNIPDEGQRAKTGGVGASRDDDPLINQRVVSIESESFNF